MGYFCKEDKPKNQVCGYTAEILTKEYNLSPLEVYSYLVYFIEDPERAEADLKAGLPPKALSEIWIVNPKLYKNYLAKERVLNSTGVK